jgi:hypothetical protein
MKSIQVYSIKLNRLYLFLVLLSPLWITVPVIIQRIGGSQIVAIILGLFLLTVTGIIAQKIASKHIDLAVENNTVSYDGISIATKDLQSIKINKTGIGTSSIEFYLKTGGKSVLTLTNLKDNANKAIVFVEKNLPEIEQIGPEDLLG